MAYVIIMCAYVLYVYTFYYCCIYTGNHTFAALSGNEDYKTLKEGFAPVLEEINDLIDNHELEVNGKVFTFNVIFGGDYKVKETYNIVDI